MTNNRKFEITLSYGLNKTGLPLVVVAINQQNLCFLLDTGSNKNLIDQRVYEYFKEHFEVVGNNSIFGLDGNKTETLIIKLSFNFENSSYSSKFSVIHLEKSFGAIERESDIQIHGILGNEFFIENGWVIDFDKLRLYSSKQLQHEA